MKRILKIKQHYYERGITNTYLAEKAGIKPSELFEYKNEEKFTCRIFLNRVLGVIEEDVEELFYVDNLKIF